MNLYKYTLSFLAFLLVACSTSENIDLSSPNSSTVTSESTLAIQQDNDEDDFDYDLAYSNFNTYWNSLLKEDNPLTNEELTLTYNLKQLMDEDFNWDEGKGGYFYLGEFTCYEKVRGTVPPGYLDENHPVGLADPNAYLPGMFWGFCINETSEEELYSYGTPFFQNGEWWTFATTDIYSNVLKDCKEMYKTCVTLMAPFATRTTIEIPDDYIVTTDGPFNEYWLKNKLKNYTPLTEEEIELSNEINEEKISYLLLADGTECKKITGGTRTLARIDELDPLHPRGPNDWGFIVWQDYYCSDENRPGRLYGDFFYQDGTWWIFVEQSKEEIDIDDPWERMDLFVWKFATRTAVAEDTFKGNYSCRADADYIERAYEKQELDKYYFYKDREKDYSKPITLEELEESIGLLEKAQEYYSSALSVRLGYNFGKPEHLDYANSYIDAVLYGMIVYTEDNLASKYAMREYLIENGPFETNEDVTSWWNANAKYSAVEWRTTDEYFEFYQGKMEPFDAVGNHIVDTEDLPDPDWIISEDYPKNTLRKFCSTYFTEQDSYHVGRYNITEFLESNTYESLQNSSELFSFYSGKNGPPTGDYLYKDWDDGINMMTCEDGGFTKEECESTASFEWENRNQYTLVEFNNITCADEMNEIVNAYFNEYKERNKDASTPAPGIMGIAYETITFYVPKLQESMPETLFSFGVWGYYASGGTMRYPYWDSFTVDLRTCEQVSFNQVIDINIETLEEKILMYALLSKTDENKYIIGSYRFDKEYFIENIFLSDSTLYVPFLNCGVYCWWHVFVNDAEELVTSQKEYEEYGRCFEPSYFEVWCNTFLTNRFSGFIAIPLKIFSS
jgi:hypothetical protein